jgi:threonine efflux protein
LALGVLISSSPAAYAVVQYLGAGYLIWLGTKMLISSYRSSCLGSESDHNFPGDRPAVKGFLISIANPKTIAYYTSLFAVLVPPEAHVWVLGAVVLVDAIACGAWWVLVAYLFSSTAVKQFFLNSRRHIDRLFGGALILLGLKLAMDRH